MTDTPPLDELVLRVFDSDMPNGAAALLLHAMRGISHDCYCAGWMHNLEYVMWHFVVVGKETARYGQSEAVDIALLRDLASAAGGWIRYRTEGPAEEWGPVFVPLPEWLERYAARRTAR